LGRALLAKMPLVLIQRLAGVVCAVLAVLTVAEAAGVV
jgi:hypothetical protein